MPCSVSPSGSSLYEPSESSSDQYEPDSAFKVYITAPGLREETVIDSLCGENPLDIDNFHIEEHYGKSTQEVVEYNKTCNHFETDTKDNPFLIFDTAEIEKRGILIVSYEEYHKYDDAFRIESKFAIELLPILFMAQDDWYNVRQHSWNMHESMPFEWFALYDLIDKTDEFDEAELAMDEALQEVIPEEIEPEPNPNKIIKYYVGVIGGGRTLDQIINDHPAWARENDYDPAYFAVIDDDYRQRGVLIVRISPERDSFRCKIPVAGEMLRWININFMSWAEAKALAARGRPLSPVPTDFDEDY